MTALHVVTAGPRSTIQDTGRPGYAHLGVPRAGAVDRASYQAANRAVGNPAGAAAIEVTLGGIAVEADSDVVIALAGAAAAATIGGQNVEPGRPHLLPAAGRLAVGRSSTGCYLYLAVGGGIDVVPVLGSRSTDTLGGLGPAPLRDGDRLPLGAQRGPMGRPVDLAAAADTPLRVHPGPHRGHLAPEAFQRLLTRTWTVTSAADRTALRLAGEPLPGCDTGLASEGLAEGAVQLPPDGLPIVFLANHPTTGGYPVVAVVDAADIGRVAQCRPGRAIRFRAV